MRLRNAVQTLAATGLLVATAALPAGCSESPSRAAASGHGAVGQATKPTSVGAAHPGSTDGITYMTEEYPPINFVQDGKLTGLSVETLRLVWKEMGRKPQPIEVLPWARAMKRLETEPNTVLFGASWSLERAQRFKWVKPFHSDSLVLLARKNSDATVASPAELGAYKVTTLIDDIAEQMLLKKGAPTSSLERTTQYSSCLQMLAKGRVDFAAVSMRALDRWLANAGLEMDEFKVVLEFHRSVGGYMFSQGTPDETIEEFQVALDKVRQTDAYAEVFERFMK